MNIKEKLFQRKYAPLYLLFSGVIVFISAFLYASGISSGEPESEDNETQKLEAPGGDTPSDPTPTESAEVSVSPAISKRPTAKVTAIPTKAPTATLTPTSSPTVTPQQTSTPTVTITITPTPETTTTPTVEQTPTP